MDGRIKDQHEEDRKDGVCAALRNSDRHGVSCAGVRFAHWSWAGF
jgi:hypothetical protein